MLASRESFINVKLGSWWIQYMYLRAPHSLGSMPNILRELFESMKDMQIAIVFIQALNITEKPHEEM